MKFKKIVSAAAVTAFTVISVHANSAITYVDGSDGTGVVVLTEDCPLVVEHEDLIFHIDDLPSNYYSSTSFFENYNAKVTAEYTVFNPTELDIHAVLAFPFGTYPHYIPDDARQRFNHEKYNVQVNGETISSDIRATYKDDWSKFSLEHDIPLLQDGYMADNFYAPELPVTEYVWLMETGETDLSYEASAVFRADEKTRILTEPQERGSYDREAGTYEVGIHAEDGKKVTLYVFGEDTGEPEWTFSEQKDDRAEAAMTLQSRNEYTFLDYVFRDYDDSSEISVTDWYNAYVTMLKESSGSSFILNEPYRSLEHFLMRWYVYEIDLGPGERLINTVTAPMYPKIDTGFDPAVYTYTYLLSPASTWKEFSSLDIRIETPYEMLRSNHDSFVKDGNVYTQSFDRLPEQELEFELCTVSNPKRSNNYGTYILLLLAGGILIPLVLFILLVVLIIRFIRRR